MTQNIIVFVKTCINRIYYSIFQLSYRKFVCHISSSDNNIGEDEDYNNNNHNYNEIIFNESQKLFITRINNKFVQTLNCQSTNYYQFICVYQLSPTLRPI